MSVMKFVWFAQWKLLLVGCVLFALGCKEDVAALPAVETTKQAFSTPSCEWVPTDFQANNDGCDCPLNGDTSCDPDCADNGAGSWCGCDYCFDGSGNEAEEPPPGWGDDGGSGSGSGGSGSGGSGSGGSGSGGSGSGGSGSGGSGSGGSGSGGSGSGSGSSPVCEWVPDDFQANDDGCDCPLDGNTSCDPDCANNGEGSWCGCDYCFDGSGNEAEDPPPGWGNEGTGGSGSGGSGMCASVPSGYVSDGQGCDCPQNGDTSCDPDCADNGEEAWCGCDYCYDEDGEELQAPPDGSGGSGPVSGNPALIGSVFENAPDSTVTPSAAVGRLANAGSVSLDGAYVHRIPIRVPQGRAGMQPTLGLAYHSRGDNGVAGVGWSLTGWSSITRCRKNYASGQDLPDRGELRQVEGVQFDGSDEFCLDGHKLLLHEGVYGQPGSEYRTEIDSFSRIRLDNDAPEGGPGQFTVHRKDGRVAIYTAPEEPLERILRNGDGSVAGAQQVHLVWPLSTLADRAGNFVEYRATTLDAGLPVLESISYTRCAGNCGYDDADRLIEFQYEPRQDSRTRFINGVAIDMNHRLSRIISYAPHPESSEATQVLQYALEYTSSSVSQRSLLSTVTLCDGYRDDCRAAATGQPKLGITTHFEWQGERPEHGEFITLGGEFVESCTGDICSGSPHAFPYVKFPRTGGVFGNHTGDDKFAVVDANGDGNDDLVVKVWPNLRIDGTFEDDDRSHEERILFGDGDGYFGPSRPLNLPQSLDFSEALPPWNFADGRPPRGYPIAGEQPCLAREILDWGNAIAADLDQDGRQELVATENRGCALTSTGARRYVGRAAAIFGNYAVLSLTADRFTMEAAARPEIDSRLWAGTKLRFADMNGDGLPDLLTANIDYDLKEALTPEAWEASGAEDEVWRFQLAQPGSGRLAVSYDAGAPSGLSVWHAEPWIGRGHLIVDEDNDGRQELVQQSFGILRTVALNRDLLPEFHVHDEETGQSLHALNQGDLEDELLAVPQWWEAYDEDQPTPYAEQATRGTTRFLDINGDGLPDAMNLFVDESQNVGFEVRINTGAGYLPPHIAMLNGPEFAQNGTYGLIAREEREDVGIRIADFNGDGLDDVAYVGNFGQPTSPEGGVHIAYSDGASFSSVVRLPEHQLRRLSIRRGIAIQVAELDGNGLPDLVEMAHSLEGLHGLRQVVTRSRHQLPGGTDLITAVIDDYGEAEKVTYDNLSHRTTRPGGDSRTGRFVAPAHLPDTISDEGVSCAYPAKCVARGSVVRSYENKRARRKVSETYHYFGARSDVTGRGWLGFRKINIQDQVTGRIRQLTFDQSYVGGRARNELFHLYPNVFVPSQTFTDLHGSPTPGSDLEPWMTGAASTAFAAMSRRTVTWSSTRPLRPMQTTSVGSLVLYHQYGEAPQGNEVVVTNYDSYGNVTHRLSEVWASGAGNVIQEVDTEFDIRETDWLVSLPETVVHRSYDSSGLYCAGCNENVTTVELSFDAHGQLESHTVAPGQPDMELKRIYDRDSAGLVRTVTERTLANEERAQSFTYDDRGVYPRDITNALGHTTRTIYDPRVDALAIATDPNGISVQYEYDGLGRPIAQRAADGSELYVDHAADSETVTELGGAVKKTFFDEHGREVVSLSSTFNDGTTALYTLYDSLGNVTRTAYAQSSSPLEPAQWDRARAGELAIASNQLSAARYDTGNRIVWSTTGSNETTTYKYGGLFSTSVTDPEGRISTVNRDALGRINRLYQQEVPDPNSVFSVATEYRYAPQGGLAAVGMPGEEGDHRREFLYDQLGRLHTERGMDGLIDKIISYSAFGDVERILDRGMTVDFEHDELGRVIERREAVTGDFSEFAYDSGPNAIGSLVQAAGIDGHAIDYAYDALGRLSDTIHSFANGTQQRLSVGRSYDERGRLAEIRYPEVSGADEFAHPSGGGLRVRYEYKNGQLAAVLDAQTGSEFWRATHRHPVNGMTTRATNGAGLVSNWAYDPSTLRLQGLSVTGTTVGEAPSLTFGYDRSGLLTSRTNGSSIAEEFEYDGMSRLNDYFRVIDGWAYQHAVYGYQPNGNLTHAKVTASLTPDWPLNSRTDERYVYDSDVPHLLSRIEGVSGDNSISFSYDGAGRMLTRTTSQDTEDLTIIGYNSFDLPVAIESNRGEDSFFYDAFGSRVRKTRGQDSVAYVEDLYELHDFAAVESGGDRRTRSVFRIYGDAGPIALLSQEWDSGEETVSYLHLDHQGSITFKTTGTQSEKFGYFPFGRRMGTFPSPTPEFASDGYTGHAHDDDLGLINMRGRMYDPRTRRFLTPDPAVGMLFHSGGANLYSFVVNSPLNLTDPSGYHPEDNRNGPGSITMDPLIVTVPQGDRSGAETRDRSTSDDSGRRADPQPIPSLGTDPGQSRGPDGSMGGGGSQGPRLVEMPEGQYGPPMTEEMVRDFHPLPTPEQTRVESVWYDPVQFASAGVGIARSLGAYALQRGLSALAAARGAPQVGRTVLGHYPAYVEKAAELGAQRFSVPTNIWNNMSPAQQWAANQRFLDRMIARGDQVILATQANAARPGSFFARELQYLKSQGYQLAEDGLSMFKP